jgi:ABC-2 type transport system permease protein
MAEARTAGAIYDLGYQPYAGVRYGRGYVLRSLFRYSFNSAFGIGRGEKAKSMPALVVAAVYLPAIIQLGVASAMGVTSMLHYAAHLQFTAFLLALFAASQAPELIVSDKQNGALAKLGALAAAMLVITLGPQLLLFVGKVFIGTSPWAAFQAEWTKLFPILGGTLLVSLFIASIGLLLSSFASRRGYATASVIVFFLLAPAVVDMFRSVTSGSVKRYSILLHPIYLMTGFTDWLFDVEAKRRTDVGRADLPGSLYMYVMLVACALCIAAFVRRYRRAEA